MFCISFIISFCFYKFISRNIFFVFCSIFLRRNSLTILINIFCNYIWSWFYFLVDMFCITFFIGFGFYKFIAINVFISLFTIYLRSNSLTIFIHVFCYYLCSRRISFLLVDVFCIAFFISFGFYKFIAINSFFSLCSFFWKK